MLASAKFHDLAFVVGPESAAFYGAVTPAWKTLDAVEEAEAMIEWTVERELSFYTPWKPRRRTRTRRFIPRSLS